MKLKLILLTCLLAGLTSACNFEERDNKRLELASQLGEVIGRIGNSSHIAIISKEKGQCDTLQILEFDHDTIGEVKKYTQYCISKNPDIPEKDQKKPAPQ